MALDEYGAPIRKLDPDLFCEDKAINQAGRKADEIWVTPDLQQAAHQFEASWDRSHGEAMTEHSLQLVVLKFKDTDVKKHSIKALQSFANLYKAHLSSDVVLPEGGAETSVTVLMRIEFVLPDIFGEIVRDLAKTSLSTVIIKPEVQELAELYFKAYQFPFVRLDLRACENADQSIIDQLEQSLVSAQQRLMGFLKILLSSLPSEEVHRVVVHDVDRIDVDGVKTEFKGAAKRALLALALLHKPTFKPKDFVRYYNGEEKPGEPRHDFDNAMNALKKILPHVASKTGGGNRTVNNLQIRVVVSDTEIITHLKFLYS